MQDTSPASRVAVRQTAAGWPVALVGAAAVSLLLAGVGAAIWHAAALERFGDPAGRDSVAVAWALVAWAAAGLAGFVALTIAGTAIALATITSFRRPE